MYSGLFTTFTIRCHEEGVVLIGARAFNYSSDLETQKAFMSLILNLFFGALTSLNGCCVELSGY